MDIENLQELNFTMIHLSLRPQDLILECTNLHQTQQEMCNLASERGTICIKLRMLVKFQERQVSQI